MDGDEGMNYLEKQIKDAKDNYNYFFIKLISCIFKTIGKLSIVLLISSIFNYTIINIIALIYTIYSMYNLYFVWNYYFDFINSIKNTLGYNNFTFEIDLNMLHSDIFRGVVKYGK